LAKKKNNQKVNYTPAVKKKKQDPMIFAVCAFGAVVLISLPILGKVMSDAGKEPEVENFSNSGWNSINGEMIYIDPDTHQKAVGLYQIDGKSYLFDADGGITPGWTTFDENVVYVTKDGTLASGLYMIGSDTFYFDQNNFGMFSGFKSVDGAVYCFSDDGRAMKGFTELDDGTYYFNEDGVLQTGWFQAGDDGKNYYSSDSGVLAKGWKILEDGTHYFTEDFSAASGNLKVDDTVYSFDEFGCPDASAEVTTTAPVTTAPDVTTTAPDVTKAEEKPVTEAPEEGRIQMLNDRKEPFKGRNNIDGKNYFLDENGYTLPQGFSEYGDNKDTYYTYEDGTIAVGEVTIDHDTYLFGDDGIMKKECFQSYNGKTVYFLKNGKMAKGFTGVNGQKYYFSYKDGNMQKGYISVGPNRYYLNDQGVVLSGWIRMADDNLYYFNNDGAGVSGYQYIGDNKYYFDSNGILQTGFQTINGTVYYFGNDGIIRPGHYEYNGEMRNFNENGMMTE